MLHNTDIKTLKDGSIDYAHYITKSHEIRSHDAHQALVAIGQAMNTIVRMGKRSLALVYIKSSSKLREQRFYMLLNSTES